MSPAIPFEEGKDYFSLEGKLFGSKCKKCGDYGFPPRKICKKCLSEEVEKVELSGRGVIHSSAVVVNAPLGFEGPYGIAYIDLEEGPRLFAQLASSNPEEIKPGTEVEMVIGPLRIDEKGNEVIGYKFKPVA